LALQHIGKRKREREREKEKERKKKIKRNPSSAIVDSHPNVSVLFADIVGFTTYW